MNRRIFNALFTILIVLNLVSSVSAGDENTAGDIELPEVRAVVVLQAELYSNGDSAYFAALERPANNTFTIRDAKVVLEGVYRDHLEYNLEIGSASCLEGGFMIMEAGVMLKPLPHLKAGMTKGHVLRGFEMAAECVELLTAEKPLFAKKFSPCHPLGFTVEYERDFGEYSGLLAQLVLAEGAGGTIEDEHDINLGIEYRTPIKGLAVAGSCTFWRWNAPYSVKDSVPTPGGGRDDYDYFWVPNKQIYDGYRATFGLDYNANNLSLRGEGYIGKGFKDLLDIPYYAEIWADSTNNAKITGAPFEDLEMKAFYVQAGYSFPVAGDNIEYVQPYVQYQWWNQAANLDGDYRSSFLTFGVDIGIGPGSTRCKIEYQTCLAYANEGALPGYSEDDQADRIIMRMQVGI
jgi:hypothetical protein